MASTSHNWEATHRAEDKHRMHIGMLSNLSIEVFLGKKNFEYFSLTFIET